LQPDYLDPGNIPPLPDHLPKNDDPEPLGVSFFRTFVGDGVDLSNLTLPRTFFGRSEINDTSFQNTDFTESNLCWNDFVDVDFTDTVLTRCDLRASSFKRVKFVRANLQGADLRRSLFEGCDFDGALMEGAVLTHKQGSTLILSSEQRARMSWTDDDGPEPGGG
jgi:uncharacterized protein YjbI with pentapeptide repeats